MSEEQNIPQGNSKKQIPNSNEENVNEHFPEDCHAPQPQTSNPEPLTTKMEVHHHSYPDSHRGGKKNWKAYFWEFLMLFLAVFCGFLAEYQLEHKIERDRAKELARSFYDELKNDSVNMAAKYQGRIKQENALKYLMKYFKDSSVSHVSKAFVLNFLYGMSFRAPSLFEPRTVVLEQLKNSGSLRYFKSNELQKLIGDLSVAIYNINDRNAIETSMRTEYINPLFVKHYDMDFDLAVNQLGGKNIFENILIYEKSDSLIPFQFKKINDFDAEGSINILGFYALNGLRGTRQIQYQKYTEVNEELLKLLRKEYHLK